MRFKFSLMLLLFVVQLSNCQLPAYESSAPLGFVDITDIVPSVQLDMRYYTSNNFIGRPVVDYFADRCFLTQEAAAALAIAQQQASSLNYSLKIYDFTGRKDQ